MKPRLHVPAAGAHLRVCRLWLHDSQVSKTVKEGISYKLSYNFFRGLVKYLGQEQVYSE